jgi:Flp pilus assembly protein TadG
MKARQQRTKGATAVEFALIAPVLFLSVFGLIEMSRMMMVQQAFTNAAREGCRKAALATTTDVSAVDTEVRDYLRSVVPNVNDTSKLRVTVTPNSISNVASGSTMTVAVSMSFAHVSWVPGTFVGGDVFDITGRASKQRE